MAHPINGNNPLNIGSRLEPFFDDWLIERMDGVSLRLHEPIRREIVLEFDRPWEGLSSGSYVSVFSDGDIYRMYYRGSEWNVSPNMNLRPVVCYAESRDGIRWERPNLGLFEHEGSASNNIVKPETDGHDNFMAFKDLNPDVDESQLYKAVEGKPGYGFMGFVSPDGIHWNRASVEPFFPDDRHYDWISTAFWDAPRGTYVAYLRSWITDAEHGSEEIMNLRETLREIGSAGPIRTIRRCTSDDFASWTDTRLIEYDVPLSRFEQLYTNGITPYPRAPHILIGLSRRFTPLRKKHADHPSPGLSDGVFMTSRDGVHWKRWTEALIRSGLDQMNWIERNNTPAWGVLQTEPDELSIYWTEHFHQEGTRLRRGTLRTDGFVSVNAGYSGGEFTTRPLVFEGGELELNYSTSAVGSVRIEIQDAKGSPLPDYGLDDCPELFGDEIAGAARWENGTDVSALAGTPVRLRFALKDADLYSIRFRQ